MNSEALPEFWECFGALPASIRIKAGKAFALWQVNPKHRGLHFKKVNDRKPYLFSVRIDLKHRALARLVIVDDVETFLWFWIGSHDEYDLILSRHQ